VTVSASLNKISIDINQVQNSFIMFLSILMKGQGNNLAQALTLVACPFE
jgi:hypothetical protein